MLTSAPRERRRRGVTLVELLVGLTVSGIALGLIASISLRQQRVLGDLADAGAVATQLRDAASVLPVDLRGVSPTLGDIREARDTALEFRGAIGSAVVCDTAAGSAILSPASAGSATYGSFLTAVDAGDTAWVYTSTDSTEAWQPYRVVSAAVASAGACAPTGPVLPAPDRAAARTTVVLQSPPPNEALLGAIVRVTRPFRFSLYRASDGSWYLGAKDWSTASQRFNTIQPVSGPFASAGTGGLVFHYLDSLGAPLSSPVSDTKSIAVVRVDLRGQTRNAPRALGSAGSAGRRIDSASIVILVHNLR